MSTRAAVGVLAVAAVAAAAGALTGRPTPERPEAAGPGPAATRSRPAPAGPAARGAVPARNVFEYGEAPAPVAAQAPPRLAPLQLPSMAPLPPATPPPVRLVGLVQRGGTLHAALVIAGETVVLAPRQSSGGYTVVSVDADAGVRLRGPDGTELTLPPEGE